MVPRVSGSASLFARIAAKRRRRSWPNPDSLSTLPAIPKTPTGGDHARPSHHMQSFGRFCVAVAGGWAIIQSSR